jgi:nicotinamidase-related amidase
MSVNVQLTLLAVAALAALVLNSCGAAPDSAFDGWEKIKAPAPPKLEPVEVNPNTTALLILDIEELTTNMERRPRAVASVPRIAGLAARAREAGAPVAYSLTRRGTPETIIKEVAPRPGEAIVQSSVDKFYNTGLEKVLEEREVKQVVIVGTAAEGAVLHTATGAAIRGFDVIVPVDGMSSNELYAEQYTAWHLANAPGTRRRAKLTKIDMISFK